MKLADLVVEVRDKDLNRIGQIKGTDLDIEVVAAFNEPGTWSVRLPAGHVFARELRKEGSGIIVTGPEDVILSGPTTSVEDSRTKEDRGTVVISGVGDTIHLFDRLAYPKPSTASITAQDVSHDVRTGPVETLMHAYVNANLGPDAPSARRLKRLVMGENLGRGETVTKRARFPHLHLLLADLGNEQRLGFRIVQRGKNLVFETMYQRDRTKAVRLTIENRRLVGHVITKEAPEITHAIVGGKGYGKRRTFATVTTDKSTDAADVWGRRIEAFVDQRASRKAGELTRAGKEALEHGGYTAIGVAATPNDDSGDMEFGRHWRLGDEVAVEIRGEERYVLATGVMLKADEDGLRTAFILGDWDAVWRESDDVKDRRPKKKKKRNHKHKGGKGKGGKRTFARSAGDSYMERESESPGEDFGRYTGTTDGSGIMTVPHGLEVVPEAAIAIMASHFGQAITIHWDKSSSTETNLKFYLRTHTNTPFASTSCSITWHAMGGSE